MLTVETLEIIEKYKGDKWAPKPITLKTFCCILTVSKSMDARANLLSNPATSLSSNASGKLFNLPISFFTCSIGKDKIYTYICDLYTYTYGFICIYILLRSLDVRVNEIIPLKCWVSALSGKGNICHCYYFFYAYLILLAITK